MNNRYLHIVCLLLIATGITAQQKNELPSRSMTIEGVYNANVTDAGKVMPVPEKTSVEVVESHAEYALDAKPYEGYDRVSMGVPDCTDAGNSYDGIVRLGYGMGGNVDGLLDYRRKIGGKGLLALNGGITGWNTKIENEWKSKFYDTDFSVAYTHHLDKVSFGVKGDVGYDFVNFMPGRSSINDDNGRQVVKGEVEANFCISAPESPWLLSAAASWSVYSDNNITDDKKNGKENLLRLKGTMRYVFDNSLSFSADGLFRASFYKWEDRLRMQSPYVNYMTASLRPSIRFEKNGLDVSLGADITARNKVGHKFQFAPIANISYRVSDKLLLSAKVDGGVEENDMRHLSAISPYWVDRYQIVDGYTKFNAVAEVGWNVNRFLELSFRGGYGSYHDKAFAAVSSENFVKVRGSVIEQFDASLAFGEIHAAFIPSGNLSAQALLGYYKWDIDGYDEYLQMLPQFSASLNIRGNITNNVFIEGNYVFALLTECHPVDISVLERLPAVNQLDVELGYRVSPFFDISVKGLNILASRHYRYAGYRSQDVAVMASLLFRF